MAAAQNHVVKNHQEQQPSLLVFSGGTAFNGVVEELKKLTTRVAHVLPVSDDGGSTAEIARVLGGPAVGDIRSRCLRLSDESTSEALAVRRLLGHRLPLDAVEAKSECKIEVCNMCFFFDDLIVWKKIKALRCLRDAYPSHIDQLLPIQYINALMVPRDGQIPVDIQCLAAQGIFDLVTLDSIHDPKVGITFDPKSLIQALDNLIAEYKCTHTVKE